ncbi:hypothetical protein BC829DRAFT_382694 [Chytridium lagenaria]|nr:hypothetical protein BC829DRAFT_382694 [Chytridium lagenaria]
MNAAAKLGLYRDIRRLHRQLPPALRLMGNKYIKDEWARHRKADQTFVTMFIKEWQMYREMLASQVVDAHVLHVDDPESAFGKNLNKDQFEALSDDQIGQLYTLKQEVYNPGEGESKKA